MSFGDNTYGQLGRPILNVSRGADMSGVVAMVDSGEKVLPSAKRKGLFDIIEIVLVFVFSRLLTCANYIMFMSQSHSHSCITAETTRILFEPPRKRLELYLNLRGND